MAHVIDYHVRVVPGGQALHCTLDVAHAAGGDLRVACPAWMPGAYALLKLARDVVDVRAEDAATGGALAVVRDGWQGFRVPDAPARVRLTWRAVAADIAWAEIAGLVFHDRALLAGARYLAPVGYEGPVRVRYELPEGWTLHHPSGARKVDERTFEYARRTDLLDVVALAGAPDAKTQELEGTPFHFVFFDRAAGFEEGHGALVEGVLAAARAARAVFGAFPFAEYTFFVAHDPRMQWGLEHPDCTTIGVGQDVYADEEAMRAAVRVAAHELFHAWNVCRMKPRALLHPDLERGSFVDGLWVSEGFTRYYEMLLSTRAGRMSASRFFSNVVRYHEHLSALPAYGLVTPADASLAAFLNRGRFPGQPDVAIDYYDAGMLVAFDLDQALRERGSSLDEALRAFYAAHLAEGFDTSDVRAFFAGLAPELGTMVEAEAERPGGLSTLERLGRLGFGVERSDRGEIGVVFADPRAGRVASVLEGSPAAAGGLAAGDEIVRVAGHVYSPRVLAIGIRRRAPLALGVRRGHREHELTVTPRHAARVSGLVWKGSEAARDHLAGWLGCPVPWEAGERISLSHYDNFHGTVDVL